ncbi:MAG: class I SAM-dependent methyltransferase, partial [Burkholderiales bacterium]
MNGDRRKAAGRTGTGRTGTVRTGTVGTGTVRAGTVRTAKTVPAQAREDAAESTDFGFERVASDDKARRVGAVFDSVAERYDLMNDLMSGGLHRLWKRFAVARAAVRPGMRILDIAGGTGDLARLLAREAGPSGEVWLTDVNGAMLAIGRDRMLDEGLLRGVAQCDAERLPFPDRHFDLVTVAFGLRNMTHKDAALVEMHRVIEPGGRLLVLEFSRVWKPLEPLYDAYSFGVLPWLGTRVAGDADSYRYLAESIRMHPDQ